MCITAIALLEKYKSVPFSLRDYFPYGTGGSHIFWGKKQAHSPNLNVIGSVCGSGQILPLHFLQGNFNLFCYHDWLSKEAIPWLQANLPAGINYTRMQMRWQHDFTESLGFEIHTHTHTCVRPKIRVKREDCQTLGPQVHHDQLQNDHGR